MTSDTTLTYQVYVAPIIAIAGNEVPPGQSRSFWSPISATLISGRHDAVLVDPLMTIEQGMAVADWVSSTGKNLTTVYVTHGHGDHWFGFGAVRERFPGVRAVAAPAVVESMRKWSAPEALQTFWQPRFPGQIPDDNPVADPLDGACFELEGHQLVAVDVGHTDTDNTTVLHVPDLGLVVADDAAYTGVHQYLAESDFQGRQDWLAALDVIEALDPLAVVAGHKRYGNDDNPRIIEETRRYIRVIDQGLSRLDGRASARFEQLIARARSLLVDPSNSEVHFGKVLADPAGDQRPFERAQLRLDYGEWLRQRRRINDAKTMFTQALGTFQRLGAQSWAQRVQGELRACGVAITGPPGPPDGLGELTPSNARSSAWPARA